MAACCQYDDIVQALFPTLDALDQLPESISFQNAVEEIKRKLRGNNYSSPWDYVDDIWYILQETSNRYPKKSNEFKCCTMVRHVRIASQQIAM